MAYEPLIINNISKTIHDLLAVNSSIRPISQKMTTSTNTLEILQTDARFQSNWVNYDASRPVTNGVEIKKKKIECHELYAQPMMTQKLLDDAIINVEQWIVDSLSIAFLEKEEEAFLFGNGKNQPSGIVSGMTKKNTITADLSYANILRLLNTLPDAFLKNAHFMMHRETLYELQKLEDVNAHSIYQSKISEKIPEAILGIPVVCNNALPSVSHYNADLPLIILGNFYHGYLILDRSEIDVMQDPYTNKPFVNFYAIKRVGGEVINENAFAFLKIGKE